MRSRTIAFVDPGMRLAPYLCMAVRYLPDNVKPVFLARRVKSRSILSRCGHHCWASGWSPRRNAAAGTTAAELDTDMLIAGLRLPKDRAAVAQNTGEYRRVAAEVSDFLDRTAPDGVFCWNGSGLAAGIAAQLAHARAIPICFGENGYLPGTMQLDPCGVNAAASFSALSLPLSEVLARHWTAAQLAELRSLLESYRRGEKTEPGVRRPTALRASLSAYLRQAIVDLLERQPSVSGNRLVAAPPPSLPERFVFFPLQVRQDSQLTVHSPVYGNRLDKAVSDLVAALGEVAPEVRLVVKLHPADRCKTDYDPIIHRHPNVVWLAAGDVREVLRKAAAVVTVNSTVGVEALMFGKPVVVIGSAAYGFDGLVHRISERAQLASAVAAALGAAPNADKTERYLAFLYFEALARAHLDDYSPRSLQAFCSRLLRVLFVDEDDLSRLG